MLREPSPLGKGRRRFLVAPQRRCDEVLLLCVLASWRESLSRRGPPLPQQLSPLCLRSEEGRTGGQFEKQSRLKPLLQNLCHSCESRIPGQKIAAERRTPHPSLLPSARGEGDSSLRRSVVVRVLIAAGTAAPTNSIRQRCVAFRDRRPSSAPASARPHPRSCPWRRRMPRPAHGRFCRLRNSATRDGQGTSR